MASVLVDVHDMAPAVNISDSSLHQVVDVKTKTETRPCHGGINDTTVNNLLEAFLKTDYRKSFLESLPNQFKNLDTKSATKCLKEMR